MNPLEPRSGRDIQRTSGRLADLEFAPQEFELGQQRQYEQGRPNVLYGPGGWMEGYRQDVAGAAQRQQVAEQSFQGLRATELTGLSSVDRGASYVNRDLGLRRVKREDAPGIRVLRPAVHVLVRASARSSPLTGVSIMLV